MGEAGPLVEGFQSQVVSRAGLFKSSLLCHKEGRSRGGSGREKNHREELLSMILITNISSVPVPSWAPVVCVGNTG